MWIVINDIESEYVINLDQYELFHKGKLCDDTPTIIFYSSTGNDLTLIYKSEENRNYWYEVLRNEISQIKFGA